MSLASATSQVQMQIIVSFSHVMQVESYVKKNTSSAKKMFPFNVYLIWQKRIDAANRVVCNEKWTYQSSSDFFRFHIPNPPPPFKNREKKNRKKYMYLAYQISTIQLLCITREEFLPLSLRTVVIFNLEYYREKKEK